MRLPLLPSQPTVGWFAFALTVLILTMSGRTVAATFISDTLTGDQPGRFHYVGHWEHVRNRRDGRFFGTSSRTAAPGATVAFSFVGRIVRIYGVRGPGGGTGIVTLDGTRYPNIDFYSTTKVARSVVFDSPLLNSGIHTIVISAVGKPRLPGHSSGYINLSGAAIQ